MKNIKKIELLNNKEERLPGFSFDFPYISTRAEIDEYEGKFVPWHWHKAVEFFYIENGILEYSTPKKQFLFPAGTGGFVNSNVLHMTRPVYSCESHTCQLLHIFDPDLISGYHGSRIEKKYVMPIIAAPQIQIVAFSPNDNKHIEILNLICSAFSLSDKEIGYEVRVRETLSQIWVMLFDLLSEHLHKHSLYDKNDERLKMMMIYIREHYVEKIAVSDLAAVAYLSERECFGFFRIIYILRQWIILEVIVCGKRADCLQTANTRLPTSDLPAD